MIFFTVNQKKKCCWIQVGILFENSPNASKPLYKSSAEISSIKSAYFFPICRLLMLYITMSYRSSQRIFFICSVVCHSPRRGSILGWRSMLWAWLHCLILSIYSFWYVSISAWYFLASFKKARRNHHDDCANGECCHDADRLQVVHGTFRKQQCNGQQNQQDAPHQLDALIGLFIILEGVVAVAGCRSVPIESKDVA